MRPKLHRNRRLKLVGSMVESRRLMTRSYLREKGSDLTAADYAALSARPRTRGDCADGARPCPWVGCRWHLAIEVTRTGSIKYIHPDREPAELPVSCALDVADKGPHSLQEVGDVLNVTRERARQIEAAASLQLLLRTDPDYQQELLDQVDDAEALRSAQVTFSGAAYAEGSPL